MHRLVRRRNWSIFKRNLIPGVVLLQKFVWKSIKKWIESSKLGGNVVTKIDDWTVFSGDEWRCDHFNWLPNSQRIWAEAFRSLKLFRRRSEHFEAKQLEKIPDYPFCSGWSLECNDSLSSLLEPINAQGERAKRRRCCRILKIWLTQKKNCRNVLSKAELSRIFNTRYRKKKRAADPRL